VEYHIRLRRGEARASIVMDHGRVGPQGALGGKDGGTNSVLVEQSGKIYRPPHLSKDQDIVMTEGDRLKERKPGGGGYGDPKRRDPSAVARDVSRGYYTVEQAAELYGVDVAKTAVARRPRAAE